jgi:hypothetical protein
MEEFGDVNVYLGEDIRIRRKRYSEASELLHMRLQFRQRLG